MTGKSRTLLCVLGVLSAASLAAQAQDICPALQQAVSHAEQNFAGLRTSAQPELVDAGRGKHYAAKTLIAGAAAPCKVYDAGYQWSYTCPMTREDAPKSEMQAAFERDVPRVRACFPGARELRISNFVDWDVAPKVTARVIVVDHGSLIMVLRKR